MQWRNTAERYGALTRLLHWLMAALLILMLALGLYMEGLELSPQRIQLYGWHKSIGILLLTLVTLRAVWRLLNPVPPLPSHMSKPMRAVAHLSHWALYGLMFAMPLLGWAMSSAAGFGVSVFGWFALPDIFPHDKAWAHRFADWHGLGGWALIILISLHATAALMHHFHYHDDVLKRMLPFTK